MARLYALMIVLSVNSSAIAVSWQCTCIRHFVIRSHLWLTCLLCCCHYLSPCLSPVCLCCPVCNVGVVWPNGWTDQDETWRPGRPRPWPHCVRWGPSSPSPTGGGSRAPNFRPMSVVAKRLDGSLCIEVGLGPFCIVLDWDPAPSPKKGEEPPPNFRPISIVAKRLDASRCHSVWR